MNGASDKRAFVTGATGFTGSRLVRHLLQERYEVTALVRPGRDTKHLSESGVTVARGHVENPASLQDAVPHDAVVFHIAAAWQEPNLSADTFRDVNVTGTRNVIEAAASSGARRVVHCSTVGVHGDTGSTVANEETPFSPPDTYCESKLEGELLARALFDELGLDGVVYRPFGIYGAGDRRFLKLFRSISKRRFVMIGSGETMYHMSHVDDLCRGILLCAEHPKAVGEVFLLGGERPTSLNELVRGVAAAVGGSVPRWHIPMRPVMLAARVCETVCRPFGVKPPLYPRRVEFFSKDRAVDISKARSVLHYAPRISLEEGLARTATWYREQGWI